MENALSVGQKLMVWACERGEDFSQVLFKWPQAIVQAGLPLTAFARFGAMIFYREGAAR